MPSLLLSLLVACGGPDEGPLAGQRAPVLSAPGLDGGQLSVGAVQSRPLLLGFWASWCGPCRQEGPALRALADAHAGRLDVLTVNLGEDPATARQAHAALGLPGAAALDPDGRLQAAFAVDALPLHLLVDAEGVVAWRGASLPDAQALARVLP
jgi:cytochrome c biogenesis protein CcmG, thiol:disulfide interchange protein DsbE